MKFKLINKLFLKEHIGEFLSLISEWKYSTWKEENFLFELPQKWSFSFAIYHEKELAGFCFASNKIKDAYYIHLLFVSDKNRGQSLGKRMIDYATEIAKQNHIHKIELRCPESNIDALEFYKRAGFVIKEKLKDDVSGDEADYYLEKSFK